MAVPSSENKITKKIITRDLRNLEIQKGDRIILHSSLKSIGFVQGGARTVIDALTELIGPGGTLAMPLFSEYQEIEKIDLRTIPCRLGAVPETFRQYPGLFRSASSTHSVGLWGNEAKEIAYTHLNSTRLGINSPLHVLAQKGAWILHIGCDFRTSSIIHIAEVMAEVPYGRIGYTKRGGPGPINYIDFEGQGRIDAWKEMPGDSASFNKIQKICENQGMISHGKIGYAPSLKIKADQLVLASINFIKDDMHAILCESPICDVCVERHKLVDLHLKKEKA